MSSVKSLNNEKYYTPATGTVLCLKSMSYCPKTDQLVIRLYQNVVDEVVITVASLAMRVVSGSKGYYAKQRAITFIDFKNKSDAESLLDKIAGKVTYAYDDYCGVIGTENILKVTDLTAEKERHYHFGEDETHFTIHDPMSLVVREDGAHVLMSPVRANDSYRITFVNPEFNLIEWEARPSYETLIK